MFFIYIINIAAIISEWFKSLWGENRFLETCLLCKRNWAFWIWSWVPVMVIIRSSDPSRGSSILIAAPESWRICLIRWPPLPMMEPASCHMWKDKEMDWRWWRRLKKNIWLPQIVSGKVKHKCLVQVLWCVFISKIWERTIIQCEWHDHVSTGIKDKIFCDVPVWVATCHLLTSLGIVTCVVTTGPPMSL